MMYLESEYLPLSGLQHLRFCPRQCALIHIEKKWTENLLTAEGRVQHERVHSGVHETRKNVRTERNLVISSKTLGLYGRTDLVDFYSDGRIVPIEYKHGEEKQDRCDELQLCAQAMCLEEMLDCDIAVGALFYFKTRKRLSIQLSNYLRAETETMAKQFHDLIARGETPKAFYSPKCRSCSFFEDCFPISVGRGKSVEGYVRKQIGFDLGDGVWGN